LGNASRNARGDIINSNGVVLKSQEQIAAEWAAAQAQIKNSSKPTNIKNPGLSSDINVVKTPPAKQLDVNDQNFDAAPVVKEAPKPASSRRKITETEN
jgi:hypothetical protein